MEKNQQEQHNNKKKEYVGINFKIQIQQLTEGYKLKVATGEAKLCHVFKLSPEAEMLFLKLIQQDIARKFPLTEKDVFYKNKEKTSNIVVNWIKKKINK